MIKTLYTVTVTEKNSRLKLQFVNLDVATKIARELRREGYDAWLDDNYGTVIYRTAEDALRSVKEWMR